MNQSVSLPAFDIVPLFKEIITNAIGFWPTIVAWSRNTLSFMIVISIPLSLLFLIGILYCTERLKILRKKEAEKHDLKIEPAFEDVKPDGNHDLAAKWEKATSLLNSSNQNDWKQAILEADAMLDAILTGLGYQGESIGEKLKRVQSGDMKTLDDAWEAHKVRNQIAHEGAAFELTHHLANETIQRYKRVFEEFFYI